LTGLAALLEATSLAQFLKASQWVYPLVNAGHILGIALLIGAVIPLDLALAGVLKRADPSAALALLRPFAIAGLVLAVTCGAMLFITQATDYARNPVFLAKMALFAIAILNAVLHSRLAAVQVRTARATALLSLVLWPTVLLLGRMTGYAIA
jgi:uncharacterized membrane protein